MQINVDPNSVRAYGNSAQEIFAGVQSALEGLVTDVVNVNYKGENAVEFKTGCGNLAAEFGTALNKDMRAIADAVQDSTTNIARALGGGPVVIEFSGGMVTVPAVPPGDGTYSADTAGWKRSRGPSITGSVRSPSISTTTISGSTPPSGLATRRIRPCRLFRDSPTRRRPR